MWQGRTPRGRAVHYGAALQESEREPHWSERALCAEVDTELFYPEKGGSTREAKQVCMACDVRVECLKDALDRDERFGIWGGKSERERRRLKKLSAGERAA